MFGKCKCGRDNRYQHRLDSGEFVDSCNKYVVCMSYDEQRDRISELLDMIRTYERHLRKIVNQDTEGYVYKSLALEALNKTGASTEELIFPTINKT